MCVLVYVFSVCVYVSVTGGEVGSCEKLDWGGNGLGSKNETFSRVGCNGFLF